MRKILLLLTILYSPYLLSQTATKIKAKEASPAVLGIKYGYETKNQFTYYLSDKDSTITISRNINFKLNSSSSLNSPNTSSKEWIELYFGKLSAKSGYLILRIKDVDNIPNTKTIIKGDIVLFLENNSTVKCIEDDSSVSYVDNYCIRRYKIDTKNLDELNKYDIDRIMFNLIDDTNNNHHNLRTITAEIDDITLSTMCPDCKSKGINTDNIKSGETHITLSALY